MIDAPSTARFSSPRRFQAGWVTLAVLALFPALLAIILRIAPPIDEIEALTASFIAYGIVFAALSLGCFLIALVRARRRVVLGVLSGSCAALLAWQLSWQVPLFVADDRPMTTAPFTVLSLNLKVGQADQQQLTQRAADADVVVLVEVTSDALRSLRDGPMANRFPYVVPEDGTASNGTAIFSRFPLSDATTLPRTSFVMRSAVAEVPGLGAVTVVGAHPCSPLCANGKWASDHRVLRDYLSGLGSGPVVVAGDFNAVDDHAPMRRLDADGFVSATDIAGAGWLPTYPSNAKVPPLIPIDHVLLNDWLTASSVRSFDVAGTDHRGLIAVVGGTR